MGEQIELFTSDSDAWDDSALIKAWDSTIDSFKAELLGNDHSNTSYKVQSGPNAKKRSQKKRNKKKKTVPVYVWEIGERCHAKYSEDGLFYTADIVALCDTFATVCYIDYEEECDVMLTDLKKLLKEEPQEPQSDNSYSTTHLNHQQNMNHQHSQQQQYTNSWNPFPPPASSMPPPPAPCPVHHYPQYNTQQSNLGHSHGPIPQPPCPPHPFSHNKCTDESLATMLMSWYKTGYSTGYYQALREHNITPKDNSR